MFLIEITKDRRVDDVLCECVNRDEAILFLAQNAYGPDGWRLIEFTDYTGLDEFELPDESNAKLVLRHSGEDGSTVEDEYTTADDVRDAIDDLDDSDGYLVFASWDGDGGAKRLEQRPRLWRVDDGMGEVGIDFGREVALRINEHGRTDTDRF